MSEIIEKNATLETSVSDVMEAPFPVIGDNESLEYVSRMLGRRNPALLVRTDSEISGIITRYDVISAMTR